MTEPRRGGNQAEQDAEQGGLATAARTGDGHHLPGLNGEGDVAESGQRAARVADLELVDLASWERDGSGTS